MEISGVLGTARCQRRSVVGGVIPISFVVAWSSSRCLFLLLGWPPVFGRPINGSIPPAIP